MPNRALLLKEAMRALRQDLKLTQVQLATAVGVTPTSVYRYEAADTFPDTTTLVGLWHFALQNGSHAAIHFSEMLAEALPPLQPLLNKLSLNQEEIVDTARAKLQPQDRVLLMAFANMLTAEPDITAIRIISILLEPWMDEARAALSINIGGPEDLEGLDEKLEPIAASKTVAAKPKRVSAKKKK